MSGSTFIIYFISDALVGRSFTATIQIRQMLSQICFILEKHLNGKKVLERTLTWNNKKHFVISRQAWRHHHCNICLPLNKSIYMYSLATGVATLEQIGAVDHAPLLWQVRVPTCDIWPANVVWKPSRQMYVARAPICVPVLVGGFAFGISGGSPQPEGSKESVLIVHVCWCTSVQKYTRVNK